MRKVALYGGSGRRYFWMSVVSSALLVIGARPAWAACDADGLQASGAVYRICMPPAAAWNGNLVIWAHGYVAFNEPIEIPEDQLRLPDGTLLPDLVNALGFAFATTSYAVNGTAVRQGLADVADLVQIFKDQKGPVGKVYITGASEGGLVTALATEQHPELFAGGLAACGPIGTFRGQVNYYGDFRAVFDYFYPGPLPGEPTEIPPALIANWDAYYEGVIKPVVFAPANLNRTREFIKAALVPAETANFWPTAEKSIRDGLWYNVFGTNDIIEKLGGQPFDNLRRYYFGTSNDFQLNILVRRLQADPLALSEMSAHYDTTGRLSRPLVTLQTSLDQQVPAWHQNVYTLKAIASGSLDKIVPLRVNRYGHCNFTAAEVLVSFAVMVLKAEGYFDTARMERALAVPDTRAEFRRLARQYGLPRKALRR
jgi:pimeloyl-ACP methyl ester carboxylesterase